MQRDGEGGAGCVVSVDWEIVTGPSGAPRLSETFRIIFQSTQLRVAESLNRARSRMRKGCSGYLCLSVVKMGRACNTHGKK